MQHIHTSACYCSWYFRSHICWVRGKRIHGTRTHTHDRTLMRFDWCALHKCKTGAHTLLTCTYTFIYTYMHIIVSSHCWPACIRLPRHDVGTCLTLVLLFIAGTGNKSASFRFLCATQLDPPTKHQRSQQITLFLSVVNSFQSKTRAFTHNNHSTLVTLALLEWTPLHVFYIYFTHSTHKRCKLHHSLYTMFWICKNHRMNSLCLPLLLFIHVTHTHSYNPRCLTTSTSHAL